jgi:predicted dithiol-disulfide oxidoreductase (DUF899 family)
MSTQSIPQPRVATSAEWRAERLKLLEREKEVTKQRDRVSAQRRRLPMVLIEKDYVFDGPDGKKTLRDLFEGRTQLLVYHFMFDPEWEKGCPGCTGYIDALGNLAMLEARNTHFVLISRAPLAKLEAYKAQKGWKFPWYSSFGSEFNYDFHVTLDEKVAPVEYDYRSRADMIAQKVPNPTEGEEHGMSVFFQADGKVYHTYSAYARGTEGLTDAYYLLDLTPYGRQEDWEDSPQGWPQKPTYGG